MENEDANEFRKFEVPEAKFSLDMPRLSFRGKMGLKFFSCCNLDRTYQHDSSIKKKGRNCVIYFLQVVKWMCALGFQTSSMVFTIDKSHPVKAFKSRNVITEFGLY